MAVFKAFKPEAMNKIAKAMGYTGDMGQFQSYIEQDPMRQQQMQRYTNAAMQMAKGGVVAKGGGALVAAHQYHADGWYCLLLLQRHRHRLLSMKHLCSACISPVCLLVV